MLQREQFEAEEAYLAALRDWFAGQALAIVHKRFEADAKPSLEDIAMQAYVIADAMLEEREKEARDD